MTEPSLTSTDAGNAKRFAERFHEPRMIHVTGPVTVAGVKLAPGTYSIYSAPGEAEWEIILNRSTEQWGDEGSYNESVKKQEVGWGKGKVMKTEQHIEQFTIRPESKGS